MFKHLLVPTDGSDLSRLAAAKAIAFAGETGARLTFFVALPQHPVSFHEGYGLTDPGTRARLIATAEQQGRKKRQAGKCKPGLPQWKMCRKRLHGIPHDAAEVI
jgi:nucleotide-binding universal stress UspA family protein